VGLCASNTQMVEVYVPCSKTLISPGGLPWWQVYDVLGELFEGPGLRDPVLVEC